MKDPQGPEVGFPPLPSLKSYPVCQPVLKRTAMHCRIPKMGLQLRLVFRKTSKAKERKEGRKKREEGREGRRKKSREEGREGGKTTKQSISILTVKSPIPGSFWSA